MNPTLRLCSSLFLACVLALTSVTMALARQQTAGGETVVICTTDGLKAITLDDQGNPVAPVHLCPLCLAAVDLPPALIAESRGESRLVAVLPSQIATIKGFSRACSNQHARAPPVSRYITTV